MTLTSFLLWGAAAYAFLPNWNALTERLNADMQVIDTCRTTCPGNVAYLKKLADQAKASQNPIAEINRIANYQFAYGTDEQIYGFGDHHWPSALESVDRMHANCVGQVVLKATLAMMVGVPPAKLRLAVTPGHMVLLYRDADGWLVLNNTTLVKAWKSLSLQYLPNLVGPRGRKLLSVPRWCLVELKLAHRQSCRPGFGGRQTPICRFQKYRLL